MSPVKRTVTTRTCTMVYDQWSNVVKDVTVTETVETTEPPQSLPTGDPRPADRITNP